MTNLTIDLESISMTDDEFFILCQNNGDLRFERNANGDLIIMSPTGGETSNSNAELTGQLWAWNQENKLGKIFDSSGGFKLPNGANRSPDAAWMHLSSWNSLTAEQRKKFLPVCPDFVAELLSPSDNLKTTREKMAEYIDNGARLGWLINPESKQVEIYRPGEEVEILESPQSLSGKTVLPGFVLNLGEIW